ncbi:hypothetical protein L873DRAFT_1812080 [Choiromyces venosus 120613-1]|uniref:Uncharacterized protein n=1 Tax=Choiromyces venosus 120613-1 TaxID=1336337 RepID=A0A3N4JCL4_9PEZI|nr:hypothetical protein L873DRAFT_1812080 [Choiromyces venosus 120613-1]
MQLQALDIGVSVTEYRSFQHYNLTFLEFDPQKPKPHSANSRNRSSFRVTSHDHHSDHFSTTGIFYYHKDRLQKSPYPFL